MINNHSPDFTPKFTLEMLDNLPDYPIVREIPSCVGIYDGYEYWQTSDYKIFKIKQRPKYWPELCLHLKVRGIKVGAFAWGDKEYLYDQ